VNGPPCARMGMLRRHRGESSAESIAVDRCRMPPAPAAVGGRFVFDVLVSPGIWPCNSPIAGLGPPLLIQQILHAIYRRHWIDDSILHPYSRLKTMISAQARS